MTRGDFDETAARSDLERARSLYEGKRADAVRAYDERRDALDALKAAETHYALVMAFDGHPPKVGDAVRAGVAEGYPEGVIVALRVLLANGSTSRATSVYLTVLTPRGTYVARRLVEPRKAQP